MGGPVSKTADVLALMDEIYPPTAQAIEHRNFLIAASKAPADELPYFAAQLSVMLTLLDHLTGTKADSQHPEKWLGELIGHAFQANVAFSLSIGMMRAAIEKPKEGVVN